MTNDELSSSRSPEVKNHSPVGSDEDDGSDPVNLALAIMLDDIDGEVVAPRLHRVRRRDRASIKSFFYIIPFDILWEVVIMDVEMYGSA